MNDLEHTEQELQAIRLIPSKSTDSRILADASRALSQKERSEEQGPLMHGVVQEQAPWRRRLAVLKRYQKTGLQLAAAAAVLLLLILVWPGPYMSQVSAAEVLAEAGRAVSNLRSVHIQARMRTVAHDNFELIGLKYDFVPIEMWKQFGDLPKWRVEKPARVVVMDGKSSLLLIKRTFAVRGDVGTGFVGWLRPLLDVDQVLDSEVRLAERQGSELVLSHEQGADGVRKLLVTVEAKAQGDLTNDWLKNKSIIHSDNRRVYRFDAQTKLLEGLQVYVHAEKGEVLVFEITKIEYNLDIDPSLFSLSLPDDVVWFQEPQELADNERYQRMLPEEVARAFFQACAAENWEEVLKFWPASRVAEGIKDWLGGLEVISIGEPFRSGLYPGWFVPYEIKLRSGRVKKFNLAVRNDNPARRFVVDGGI